ncbi:DUF3899 domain-containing protein [Bacillus coahuilensis]|uniref:DUF3899 domain-containing protein n=1 Tax=Bacillus coahuilensis TaxID=408580 RepID=UPI0004942AFD|nr:DUF3899 domain-containing protein [Bacillus coahuilensis]
MEGSLLLNVVNISFFIGLSILMIGLLLMVFEAGIFNGLVYSMKKLRRNSKTGEILEDLDDIDDTPGDIVEAIIRRRSYSMTKPFLITGGLLFILTLFAAYFIF